MSLFLPAAIVLDVVVGCNLGMIANVQFPVLAPLNEEDHCHGVAEAPPEMGIRDPPLLLQAISDGRNINVWNGLDLMRRAIFFPWRDTARTSL